MLNEDYRDFFIPDNERLILQLCSLPADIVDRSGHIYFLGGVNQHVGL